MVYRCKSHGKVKSYYAFHLLRGEDFICFFYCIMLLIYVLNTPRSLRLLSIPLVFIIICIIWICRMSWCTCCSNWLSTFYNFWWCFWACILPKSTNLHFLSQIIAFSCLMLAGFFFLTKNIRIICEVCILLPLLYCKCYENRIKLQNILFHRFHFLKFAIFEVSNYSRVYIFNCIFVWSRTFLIVHILISPFSVVSLAQVSLNTSTSFRNEKIPENITIYRLRYLKLSLSPSLFVHFSFLNMLSNKSFFFLFLQYFFLHFVVGLFFQQICFLTLMIKPGFHS